MTNTQVRANLEYEQALADVLKAAKGFDGPSYAAVLEAVTVAARRKHAKHQ